jgi:hypothetical protein
VLEGIKPDEIIEDDAKMPLSEDVAEAVTFQPPVPYPV